MAKYFSNPLVIAQNVIGLIRENRNVILWKQPETELNQVLSANNALPGFYGTTPAENKKGFWNTVGDTMGISIKRTIQTLVDKNRLQELFTGTQLSIINMYGIDYVSAEINKSSELCHHPIETGEVITDTAIINPTTATVRVSMPSRFYTRIYEEIEDYFYKKKFIMLQHRYGMIGNMVIESMPMKMDNATVQRTFIDLHLTEILEVHPQFTNATIGTENNIQLPTSLIGSDTDTADLGRIIAKETVNADNPA